jgi:hypothetical protein
LPSENLYFKDQIRRFKKMSNSFMGRYEVDDGYVGGSRPQSFEIKDWEIDEDMTEEELREIYRDEMQNHFEQNIFPGGNNEDEFIEWAKERHRR